MLKNVGCGDMKDSERGTIRHREFAQQLRDFSGLVFGQLSPTDIDCFLDFGSRVFIFVEGKHGETPLRRGQELAYEHLADACQKAGVDTIVLVGTHQGTGDVDCAVMPVRNFYYHAAWHEPKKPLTVRQAIDGLLYPRRLNSEE